MTKIERIMTKLERIANDNTAEGKGYAFLLPNGGLSTAKPYGSGKVTVGGQTYRLTVRMHGVFPQSQYLTFELS